MVRQIVKQTDGKKNMEEFIDKIPLEEIRKVLSGGEFKGEYIFMEIANVGRRTVIGIKETVGTLDNLMRISRMGTSEDFVAVFKREGRKFKPLEDIYNLLRFVDNPNGSVPSINTRAGRRNAEVNSERIIDLAKRIHSLLRA